MRLLHLTDLHYVTADPFQIELVKALRKDLAVQAAKEPFDLVVFSGDLVRNPDDDQIYERFESDFLAPVLSSIGLRPSDVIFCPGNHDVSQKALAAWSDERKKMIDALRDQASLSKYLSTDPALAYVKAISQGFFSLAARCGKTWNNPLVEVYDFSDKGLSFVSMNSALGCGLEGSAYDRGKLAVASDQVLKGFQAVPHGRKVYSLVHHTPSDFNEGCARVVKPIIMKGAVAHFFGHVHDARPIVERSPEASCMLVQGGALYETTGFYNGYAIADVGPKQEVRATYRTYWPGRFEFDTGVNVGAEGRFFSSAASETFWSRTDTVPDNDEVCLWLLDSLTNVSANKDITITPRKLTETFIDPVIRVVDGNGGSTSQLLTTENLLQGKENIVLAADAEYGATSLLSYLTIQFHSECIGLPLAIAPCLIDARQIKDFYPARVTTTLRNGLPESTEPQLKLQPLHDSGRLLVLIDNVDIGNTVHLGFLQAVRSQYPKARLIAAVKMPFVNVQRLRPVLGIDNFVFAQLDTLSRGKVRALVEKWKLPSRYNTDVVTEEIDARFRALGIPMTAAYVVIYLSILQDIDGFDPINSSTVIEQFVESALQKYKPAYIFRSAFDYRNQIDYLGHITEQMCRDNSFVVDFEKIYSWTKKYFDDLGLDHDIKQLIDHFVAVKVFSVEGNSVYFRYNIFLSFFIAHQMLRSAEFKDWVKSDGRYMNYVTEIDIYCGLSRQDLPLLEFFSEEFSKFGAQLEELVKPLAWADRLEKLTLPVTKKPTLINSLTASSVSSQRICLQSNETRLLQKKSVSSRP